MPDELNLSQEETQRKNFVKVSVYIPEEILNRIKKMTNNEGVTQSEFLRHVIIDGLSMKSERWNKISVQDRFLEGKHNQADQ